MKSQKEVLTTGDVARICNVAPRTVAKWFDRGELRGYRIPGSKDRRIPLNQLIRFMKAHNIPLEGIATGQTQILIVDADAQWAETLARALSANGDFQAATASCALEAGCLLATHQPRVMVVDVSMPDMNPATLGRLRRSLRELEDVVLVGTGENLSADAGQALLQEGFSAYLSKPFHTDDLVGRIHTALGA